MVHTFACRDGFIVMDEFSGSVHIVDEPARDAIEALQRGDAPHAVRADLAARLGQADADDLLAQIEALREQGQLFTPQPPIELHSDGAIKALCLHVAHDCDLRCAYCFAATGSFHGGRSLMSAEVGCRALDFLIERSGARRTLEVDFFGGEPLMNLDVVKRIVAHGRQLEQRHNKQIRFTLTTNCMALDEPTGEYLNQQMSNVVLSIDGRPNVHDALRKCADGTPSHERVLQNALRFVKTRKGSYYARGTFTSRNLDFAADVEYLADAGFTNISVEPVVLPQSSPYALRAEHLPRILAEYDRLADIIARRRRQGKGLLFFHFNMDFGAGPCLYKRLSGCGAGCEYLAVTPQGDLYPCHQFVGEEPFLLGNVLDGSLDRARMAPFVRNHANVLTRCGDCWAKLYCGGGCAANNWHENADIAVPPPLHCDMHRKRVECAASLWAQAHMG